MDLTEERRLKQDAGNNEAVPKPAPQEPEDLPVPALDTTEPVIPDVKAEYIKIENIKSVQRVAPIPVNIITGALVFILSLVFFLLIVSSKFAEPWAAHLTDKINTLIVNGALYVLNNIQGVSAAKGEALSTVYYKISLHGDWVAFSSLELLVIFAALFVFFQKTDWKKRAVVFLAMVPLAIIANIFRLVVAFGVALNCGPAVADRYFHEILVACVFVFIILGLMLLEFLFFSDEG